MVIAIAVAMLGVAIALFWWESTSQRRGERAVTSVYKRAAVALVENRHDEAIELGLAALPAFIEETPDVGRLHHIIGNAAVMRGSMKQGLEHLEAANRIMEEVPFGFEDDERHHGLKMLAVAELHLCRYQEAADHLLASLRWTKDAGERAFAHRLIASVETSRESFASARAALDEAKRLSMDGLHGPGHQRVSGTWHFAQGRLDEADELFAAAEAAYRELGELVDAGYAAAQRAEVLSQRGQERHAVDAYRAALVDILSRDDNRAGALYVLPRLALSEARAGAIDAARESLTRATELAADFGSPETPARIGWAQALVAAAEGRHDLAAQRLEEAATTFSAVAKESVAADVRAELDGL